MPGSHGASKSPGQSAVGSESDAARGPVLGRVAIGVSWGLGPSLVAGLWRKGVLQAELRQRVVLPPSRGAECSPPRWQVRDCLGHRWLRPVVVCWWSQADVVALASSILLLAWPHVLAGNSVDRPVMVPEPPLPWLCSVASAGSGWTHWTSWGIGGAGLAKGVCWGRTHPVGWGCWGWSSCVPGPRRFGLPGPRPHFHRCPVVVGEPVADGPI